MSIFDDKRKEKQKEKTVYVKDRFQVVGYAGGNLATSSSGGGSGDALTTNPLSQFAATTSAQLAGVITDETGTGLLVFGTSPTIVTPTIASFTNAQHNHADAAGGGQIAISTGISGLAANVATFLGTPSSANLLAAITDETGTGALVFGTSPTLTTPRIASGGFIADANGNELIIFTTTASAVNELTHANAATGNNPSTNPTGGDSNIGWTSTMKGTGSRLIIAGAAGGTPLIARSAASPTADLFIADANGSSTAAFNVKPDGMFTFPGLKVLAADFSKTTDTTYATITGFSVNVRAGRTYHFKAYVTATLNTTGGGKFKFSGTATMTDFGALYQIFNPATNALIASGGATFDGDINESITSGVAACHLTIFGSFVVNAAGTFTFQFAQNSSSGTSTVNKNATVMEILEQQ